MTDLLDLLQEFHREKLSALARHLQGARMMAGYDTNNTYQYIINREETELTWVAAAIVEQGGQAPAATAGEGAPLAADGKGAEAALQAIAEDVRDAQAFVDRWRPRIDAVRHARHAKMLRLILGEVMEQKRFFEQALAGRTDLLGRRGSQLGPAHGEVLSSRWIE